uniref:Uncharacterized protein n=1 Tax=Opuntia streptacantha TaxID=393608 RepID=A0A7C9DYN2_OPUST
MALRLRVASSSLCPPDKNMMPGTAGGTVLCKARTVYSAMTSGATFLFSDPGVTMLGFNKVPSRRTWWSLRDLYTAASTRSVTSAHLSMSWGPSTKISGSTMGTKPFSWQMMA